MTCPHGEPAPGWLDDCVWCGFEPHMRGTLSLRRCPDDCRIDFGPWGAWRAGLAVVEDAARHANEMGNLKRIAKAINTLGAVGWLP